MNKIFLFSAVFAAPIFLCVHAQNLSENNDFTNKYEDLFKKKLSSIEIQNEILKYQDPLNPKTVELNELTQKGIILTNESLNELTNYFQSSLLKIDLFEGNNFFIVTKLAMDSALYANNSASISKKIASNPQLQEILNSISEKFGLLVQIENKSFEDEEFGKIFMDLLEALKDAYLIIKYTYSMSENHYFAHFIYNVITAQQVILARYAADKVLNVLRGDIEKEVQNSSNSTQASISVNIPIVAGVNVGSEISVYSNREADNSSFYKINIGEKTRISIAADAKIASLEAGISTEIMKSLIFYSLEQLIDSGNFENIIFSKKDIKKLISERKEMQAREKELLRRFSELEGFYKIFQIIPQRAYLNWVDISKSLPIDTVTTYGISGDLAATIAKILGMSLKCTVSEKYYKKQNSYLSLLSEDCSGAYKLTSDEIKNVIGSEFDLSEKLVTSQVLQGHLAAYNTILEQMANNHAETSKRELENKKCEYEKLLSPKKGFWEKSLGRNGVLKSCVVTASIMKEQSQNLEERIIFRKIYEQLERLAKLHEFSKNKDNRNASFTSAVKAFSSTSSGSLSLDIPEIGKIILSVSLNQMSGSPFQDENGEYATVSLSLPTNSILVKMGEKLSKKISKLSKKMKGTSTEQYFFEDMSEIFEIVSKFLLNAEDLNETTSYDTFLGLLPFVSSEEAYTLFLDLKKINNHWIPQQVNICSSLNKTIEVSTSILNIGISTSSGKVQTVLCSDTLSCLISKYNALRLGESSKSRENKAWEAFKAEQSESILNILKNVSNEDKNSYYEVKYLLKYFSDISDELLVKDTNINKTFSRFLDSCMKLNLKDGTLQDQEYLEAVDLLDKILEINYKYNFLKNYNRAYGISTTENSLFIANNFLEDTTIETVKNPEDLMVALF
ncbi:MAG: hypothetical protein LBS83_02605 [Holosporales bacterium]|nr:hypothetical protein [Holosporales bacterium]